MKKCFFLSRYSSSWFAIALSLLTGTVAAMLLASSLGAASLDVRKDFGAVGDGATDDTVALQNAFASGKEVDIPLGEYRFTETLKARFGTKIKGQSGSWNAKDQSLLRYDGPEGGIAISVDKAHNFQMRHVCVEGGEKADIGVYWCYSTNDALLEDVGIRGSRKHGLFVTNTWYAHFNRIHVRKNLGAGVTLARDGFDGLAKGPVNYTNFFQSIFHSNGLSDEYDGEKQVAVGYGVGSFGSNSVINFIACAMERNGGPGVYLGGQPTTLTFSGCYIEHNSASLYRALERIYGEGFGWRTIKDRKPNGRMTSILDETFGGRGPIVFDQCYVNPQNGIWLKGPGGKFPLAFRGMWHPIVYWSENANWVAYDSSSAPLSSRPGIIYRPTAGELADTSRFTFHDPEPGPSGHPAYTVKQGVRRLVPILRSGLLLHVNTEKTDTTGDGRTEATAFSSLQKVFSLLQNTQLDQEVRVRVVGAVQEPLFLRSVKGSGGVRLELEKAVIEAPMEIAGVDVPITIEQGVWSAPVHLKAAQQVTFAGATFQISPKALLGVKGSKVRFENCQVSTSSENLPVRADWASTVSFEPPLPASPFFLDGASH